MILPPQSFVALYGDLGGGKTSFTRGLVAASSPENGTIVTSPTYSIMNEYSGKIPIYHFDFYRIINSDDFYELGFNDYFNGDGICIAEWPERVHDILPENRLVVSFNYKSDNERIIVFTAYSNESQIIIKQLQELYLLHKKPLTA